MDFWQTFEDSAPFSRVIVFGPLCPKFPGGGSKVVSKIYLLPINARDAEVFSLRSILLEESYIIVVGLSEMSELDSLLRDPLHY